MSHIIEPINKKEYKINPDDFIHYPHQDYNNLRILPRVGMLERHAGILIDIQNDFNSPFIDTLTVIGDSDCGFIASTCSEHFDNIRVCSLEKKENVKENLNNHKNISYIDEFVFSNMIYIDQASKLNNNILDCLQQCIDCYFILSPLIQDDDNKLFYFEKFKLSNVYCLTGEVYYYLYVNKSLMKGFKHHFHYYIREDNLLDYNNIINLCIMVKNAGPLFEKVLTENLPYIDRWTILDTGSTDETIDIINRVLVGKKKGNLYQEPFINFRDSRNRCLELAGKTCKYNIMLDDTYVIQGDLRLFLETIRGDQFADSYSLLIKSGDSEYYSNRITKSQNNLKYIYKIHEVIQEKNNVNVVVPNAVSWIFDYREDYMEKRTMDRKLYDLQLLFEEVEENPNDPRHLYYIAQTYNLLDNHEKAAEYFLKRINHPVEGFKQEKVDSLFEVARTYNFKLNKPWEECEKLYLQCCELEPTRPDSFYFIGVHYYMENNYDKAYEYIKKAFEIGFPVHTQFSLKPTLSYYFVPKFLAHLCYIKKDFKTGEECSKMFLEKNNPKDPEYITMQSWYEIFVELNKMPELSPSPLIRNKPVICYVADGGFSKWTGRDILTKGVGGSETYIIEMARYIRRNFDVEVLVFCRCSEQDVFEGVKYYPIEKFQQFVSFNEVDHCIVSRFSHYIPVAIHSYVKNIHLVLHDLGPTGNVIPMHNKLKNVFCLTEWHKDYFLKNFPMMKEITHAFHYGIDFSHFKLDDEQNNRKIHFRFIYSSFPNRGLLVLLNMWDKIKKKLPFATLEIYSDVYNDWSNNNFPEMMKEIRSHLWDENGIEKYYARGIIYRSWVSKKQLAEGWKRASIWFYPCIFQETFCLTALEAALSKTLAISNNLAALRDTVGERGVAIEGDPMTQEWQDRALEEIVRILINKEEAKQLVEKNYEWALEHSWEKRAKEFYHTYLEHNEIKFEDKKLNYMGMYNWTNDIPTDSRRVFESVLRTFENKKAHILEIGSFAGTSLIEMLRILPDAEAVAIDRWENYIEKRDNNVVDILEKMEEDEVEKVFEKNLKVDGVDSRVSTLKGDSVATMLDLIRSRRTKFDFVYVDASHKCIDCYTDMVLGWDLLNSGGVMGVDDYLYNMKGDLLESPYEGVNHFLEKYRGKYEILNKEYRVFLKKL